MAGGSTPAALPSTNSVSERALRASASHVFSCRSEAIAAAAVIVTTTRSATSSARQSPT